MRKSAFRDEDLSPYPTDTPVKAIVISSKDKRTDPPFCESWVTRGELSDGDVIIYTYSRLCGFVMNMHSFYSFEL